ncbi:MAG: D-2-hydroxyacid dehydrogenase [Bacillales bacterium]|nr:D-2-hydroxyacid dehydrogenase [Bacillales bacterium]
MKIYIKPESIGKENYEKLKNEFNNIEFVNEKEKSYTADALIVSPEFFNKTNLDSFQNLKWVQDLMAGYNTLDINYFNTRGITVTNARDIFSISIAEDVISKILYFNRDLKHYMKSMTEKVWKPISRERELTDSIFGIIGTGSIGKEVAKRIRAFGVKKIIGYRNHQVPVDYFDEIYTEKEGLETLLKESDYVIVAVPLNTFTLNLIGKEEISHMKKDALLINVARGEIIDQNALIEALKNKQIRGAGLDVMVPEPLNIDSPLWEMDNVFITPHNASSSPFMKDRLYEMVKENISRFISEKDLLYIIQ